MYGPFISLIEVSGIPSSLFFDMSPLNHGSPTQDAATDVAKVPGYKDDVWALPSIEGQDLVHTPYSAP